MARITLISLFDHYSIGLRIMATMLHNAGHKCHLVFLKFPRFNEVALPATKPKTREYMEKGKLFRFSGNDTPWTEHEEALLIEHLEKYPADIIGISARSIFDDDALALARNIKKHRNDTLLIAGGHGPSLKPEKYLEVFNCVVFGEGEQTICRLAECVDTGLEDKKNIPNLIYSDRGRMIINPTLPPEKKLDSFPIQEFGGKHIFYVENGKCEKKDPAIDLGDKKTYPIMGSRGCVGQCSYCSSGQWRKHYESRGCHVPMLRRRSVKHIIDELIEAKQLGFRSIYFLDSFLTGPIKYLKELFYNYKKHIDLPFFCYLQPQQIVQNPLMVDLACDAGLESSVLGIQHGSETFAQTIFNRKIKNDKYILAAELLSERGVQITYHFIYCGSLETEQSLNESYELVGKLPMKNASLHVNRLQIFPDSPLLQYLKKNNLEYSCDADKWYFHSQLYYLRTLVSESDFNAIKNTSLFKDNPSILNQLIMAIDLSGKGFKYTDNTPQDSVKENRSRFESYKKTYRQFLSRKLLRENVTVPSHMPDFLPEVFKTKIDTITGSEIFIWGAGQMFDQYRYLFNNVVVKAIIDNNPEKQGQFYKGVPIVSPDVLSSENLPVFICSISRSDIYHQIRHNYPNINDII